MAFIFIFFVYFAANTALTRGMYKHICHNGEKREANVVTVPRFSVERGLTLTTFLNNMTILLLYLPM